MCTNVYEWSAVVTVYSQITHHISKCVYASVHVYTYCDSTPPPHAWLVFTHELTFHWPGRLYCYPAHACAKGLRNRFCSSVSQSVCLSICPVKNLKISTSTGLSKCCTWRWHSSLKKFNVCVPYRDQSRSLLYISSSFLFKIGIVHHFDMVNHLDTVETRHMRTPSTCSHQPPS